MAFVRASQIIANNFMPFIAGVIFHSDLCKVNYLSSLVGVLHDPFFIKFYKLAEYLGLDVGQHLVCFVLNGLGQFTRNFVVAEFSLSV